MDRIMSEGGPLICLEQALAAYWRGVDKLTVADQSAESDYERACRSTGDYILVVPLARSNALALGLGPMNTLVWRSPSGVLFVVQVVCAEPNVDEQEKLSRCLDESIFSKPIQISKWNVSSSPVVLFDAAMPGGAPDKESLVFDIRPGQYQIQTQLFEPDASLSSILHRFDFTG